MTQFHDSPNEYDFGHDFNYAVWTAGSRAVLTNVSWNNDYRDVVWFESDEALNSYIEQSVSSNVVIENMTHLKLDTPVRLDIPFNRAMQYNYVRVYNPAQPVPGNDTPKSYYYFIREVRYVAPNTTELILQLDIWQSFIRQVELGRCYIERGHIGIANSKAFDSFGRDYLTIPEGFDLGSEYQTIARRKVDVMGTKATRFNGQDVSNVFWNVLIVASTDLAELTDDPGTVDEPRLITAPGSSFEGLAHGAGFYAFKSVDSFQIWLRRMADKPWVTQSIMSVSVIPELSRYMIDWSFAGDNSTHEPEDVSRYRGVPVRHHTFNDWRNSSEIRGNLPERYRHLLKFFTFPYMFIELTTWTATPIVLKPEVWNSPSAEIMERATLTPPNQRVEFIPRHYNSKPGAAVNNWQDSTEDMMDRLEALNPAKAARERAVGDDGGEYLDFATKVANFPSLVIVNNAAIGYLASNANSLAYQHQSARWDQNRALNAAQGAYDNVNASVSASNNITASNTNLDSLMNANANKNIATQTMISAIGSTVSGLAGGGAGAQNLLIGAVSNGVQAGTNIINTGVQIGANNESTALGITRQFHNNQENVRAAETVRDTNYDVARFAANGDYANAIAGINARVQDASMIQPTTSGQLGGEMMNLIHDGLEASVRWKMVDQATIKRVGEYWLRYGYSVQQFGELPDDLMVMEKATYWKLRETHIISALIPEGMKQAIRGILEKGVTVYSDASFIGRDPFANNPAKIGITL